MTITFTALQRINVSSIIRAQAPPTFDQLETLNDIMEKVDFTADERAVLIKELPNGQGIVDMKVLETMADKTVELEKAEVKLLRATLEPGERFRPGVADLVWLKPLRTSLTV